VIAHAEMKVVIDHMQVNLGTTVEEARAARRELAEVREVLETRARRRDLDELREHLDERAEQERKERATEAESRRMERKGDRKFWVTTLLATAAILLTASQLLGAFT
jgi:transcriptional regulator of heat shock response